MDSDGEGDLCTVHAETEFRQILQKIMDANPESQRRKRLFSVKATENFRLRPSMVDRACLKSAVISSTPMVNLKNQPFNDTSVLPSPIDAIQEETKVKKLTPQKLYKSAVVISVSSSDTFTSDQEGDKLKHVDLPDGGKAKNLDKIISNLAMSKAVGTSLNATNKNVQTSENSGYSPNCCTFKRLTRGYWTGAKERQTQTGASLQRNVEAETSSSSESEQMLLNCDGKSLLAPLNTTIDSDDGEETNNLPSINCAAPWRGPSLLGQKLKRKGGDLFSLSLIDDDWPEEVSDDDTFLPKPKQKKVFVNKKMATRKRRSGTTKKNEKTKSIRNDSVTTTLNKNCGSDADLGEEIFDDDSFLPQPKQGKISVNKKGGRKSDTTKKNETIKSIRNDSVKKTLNKNCGSDADLGDEVLDDDSFLPQPKQGKISANKKRRRKSATPKKSEITKPNNQGMEVDPLSEEENINYRRSLKNLKVILENLYGDEGKKSVNSTHNSIDECQKVESGHRKKEDLRNKEKATKQIQKVVQKRNKNESQTGIFEDGEEGYIPEVEETCQNATEDSRISLKKGSPKKKTTSSQASKECQKVESGHRKKEDLRNREKATKQIQKVVQKRNKNQSQTGIFEDGEDGYIPEVEETCQNATEDSRISLKKGSPKKKTTTSQASKECQKVDSEHRKKENLQNKEKATKQIQKVVQKRNKNESQTGIFEDGEDGYIPEVEETCQNAIEDSRISLKKGRPKKKTTSSQVSKECQKVDSGHGKKDNLQNREKATKQIQKVVQKRNKNKSQTGIFENGEDVSIPDDEEMCQNAIEDSRISLKKGSPTKTSSSQASEGSESPPSPGLRRSTRVRRPPTKIAAHMVIVKSVKACKQYLKESSAAGVVNLTDPASISKCRASTKRARSRLPSSANTFRTMSPIMEKLHDDLEMLESASVEASTSGEENKKSKNRVKSGRVEKKKGRNSSKSIQEPVKNISNNSRCDDTSMYVYSNSEDTSDVLNIYSNSEVTTIKWAFCNLPCKPIKNMPGVSVAVDGSQGLLKIKPGKMKPRQKVTHLMNFAVIKGQAEVGVGESVRVFNQTDFFLVPPGKHTSSRLQDRLK